MAEMADADSDMKQQSRDAIISELKFRPGEDLVQYIVSLIDEVNMDWHLFGSVIEYYNE